MRNDDRAPSPQPRSDRQRLRVTYRHGPELRYISHLDLIRVCERALRRAGLPIAYSQGFNPHPRVTWAAPLPVGFTSEAELADFLLDQQMDPADFAARLAGQLPSGLTIFSVEEVSTRAPALPSVLAEARYTVSLPSHLDPLAIQRDIERLLAAESIVRPRRGKGRERGRYDLRPSILELSCRPTQTGSVLDMLLSATAEASGRPDEVLDALGYAGEPAAIARVALCLRRPACVTTTDRFTQ